MRPSAIMGSAAALALAIVAVITLFPERNPAPTKSSIRSDAPVPMQTTVEEQSGVKQNPAAPDSGAWEFGCVAVLTAPRRMQVGNTADVETALLLAAGKAESARLLQAAQNAAATINAGNAVSPVNPLTGLDKASEETIQRMIGDNTNRQAAIDKFPGSPIIRSTWWGPASTSLLSRRSCKESQASNPVTGSGLSRLATKASGY
jgi:hypothetical protein